jgi:hypothetical protein
VTGSPQLAAQALNEVAKLLAKLTEDQLADLVSGRGVIEFRSAETTVTSRPTRGSRASTPAKPALDLDALMQAVNEIPDEDGVERYLLENDKQISKPLMVALAEKIGPPVSTKGTKDQLRKNIAAGTGGLRNRAASVFSGGWSN